MVERPFSKWEALGSKPSGSTSKMRKKEVMKLTSNKKKAEKPPALEKNGLAQWSHFEVFQLSTLPRIKRNKRLKEEEEDL
jgi:hypothetical protein